MSGRHEPSRPSWQCTCCGHDWPCRRRREQLLAETTGSAIPLALFMAVYFEEAVNDHPPILVNALYVRFFGWVPRRPGHDRKADKDMGT